MKNLDLDLEMCVSRCVRKYGNVETVRRLIRAQITIMNKIYDVGYELPDRFDQYDALLTSLKDSELFILTEHQSSLRKEIYGMSHNYEIMFQYFHSSVVYSAKAEPLNIYYCVELSLKYLSYCANILLGIENYKHADEGFMLVMNMVEISA